MYKEIIISIVIIFAIAILDTITCNYTKDSTEKIGKQIEEIKEQISRSSVDKEKVNDSIEKVNNEWEKYRAKMAYYIEHDELEKVNTALTLFESYNKSEDYVSARARLDEGKFILQHIKDKNEFSIENIF